MAECVKSLSAFWIKLHRANLSPSLQHVEACGGCRQAVGAEFGIQRGNTSP